MIDSVRYLVGNAIKWRAMPCVFPPWPRAYAFFARWRDAGLVAELHDRLRDAVRRAEGRSPDPTAAIVDVTAGCAQVSTVPGQGGRG
ncbi:transposase [Streptomyces sp. NPDC056656]|uniref:transposase n=1 Tax=Streptomyces sp. NPDC056656 TaxID=3345895 RepID=UPI00368D5EDD